jgi:hypothetical protein
MRCTREKRGVKPKECGLKIIISGKEVGKLVNLGADFIEIIIL